MRSALSLYLKYFRRLRRYYFILSVGILTDLFSSFLMMVPPLLSILLFDHAYPERNFGLLTGAVGAGLLIYFVNFFFSSINDYINVHLDQKLGANLTSELFDKTLRLPHGIQSKRDLGDLSVRILEDSDLSAGLILNAPQNLIVNGMTLLFFLAISFSINPRITLLALASIPVYLWQTHFFAGHLEELQDETQGNESLLTGGLQERLLNLRTIKAFGQEAREGMRFRGLLSRKVHLGIKQNVISLVSQFSNSVTLQVWSTFVLWFMGLEVIRGRLSIGQLVALSAYLPQMIDPVRSLAGLYTSFRVGMVSLKRFDELNELPEEREEGPKEALSLEEGKIELKEIFFGYEEAEPILKEIGFEIPPHSSLAVVGASGAGKSTLLHLLLRFHDPTAGTILIDGHKIQEIQCRPLRRQIGVVFQEISLFAGTIRENILYGRPDASGEEIREAARLAAADSFISQLPAGYDSPVEMLGRNLSGGQRQRIAIARALIMKPKILILDEATSALDAESEYLFQETVRKCAKQMTVIVVAHRLTSLRAVDKIVVLDQGKVVESGSFSKLLDLKGVFFKLFSLQTSGLQEFQRRLEIEFMRHQRYFNRDLSLILLRIKEYPRLLAQETPQTLNRLLEEINLFVYKRIRIMDFSSVYRNGSLLIGLPEVHSEKAKQIATRLHAVIENRPFRIDGRSFTVSLSMSVTSFQERQADSPKAMIENLEEQPCFI